MLASLKKQKDKKFSLALIAGLVVAIFVIYKIYSWSITESTDNAYVEADITLVKSQVSGEVIKIHYKDNQKVKAGDLLLAIDDRTYAARLAQSQALLTSAQQKLLSTNKEVEIQKLEIKQLEEAISILKLDLIEADKDFKRQANLVQDSFSSKQRYENSKLALEKARFNLASKEIDLEKSKHKLELLNISMLAQEADIDKAHQEEKLASKALQDTKIHASIEGIVGNNNVELGNIVNPGEPLFSLVSTNNLSVIANFKETQVGNMKEGMLAEIKFDAYPGFIFKGEIESIAPATGSRFSLIPPENASGNFTKIVQRVPVKIKFKISDNFSGHLLPGMSSYVSIKTR